jgi:hypothetical protein
MSAQWTYRGTSGHVQKGQPKPPAEPWTSMPNTGHWEVFDSAYWNPSFPFAFFMQGIMEADMGRGILLWLLGVPIPVIILLWLFFGRW